MDMNWNSLSRWERTEVGRALRRRGLSYGEIMRMIPVPKGTLAGWCRDIDLTPEQAAAIVARTGSRKGVPRDTQRKRRAEVERIREEARVFAQEHLSDPLWVAGTALYWGEGTKSQRMLEMANADPRALRLFVEWIRWFHTPTPDLVLMLHLHAGNDEEVAKAHWRIALQLPSAEFHKTFVKPPGTGHRKNSLATGVCRVRLRRSADAWIATMEWIDVLAANLPSGR